MKIELFRDQKYAKLRKHHQELGVPWTDSIFPASNASIGLKKSKELQGVEWRRISELCNNPRLVKDGVGRHDVVQGKLGNCWFVAAASVLAGIDKLWEKVIPDVQDQEWDAENPGKYSGVFRFRFWRFGRWIEVLVDDLIPTRNGSPVFTYSKEPGEFWSALLEKAYAKLNGSYEALDGGNISDALVDFTGGVAELIQLRSDSGALTYRDEDKKTELYNRILKEIGEHALICCAIRCESGQQEEKTDCGLVKGHAYGVTAVKKVPVGSIGLTNLFKGREKLSLVRLRNPWGEKEWNGAFSDSSMEWRMISDKEKQKLGLVTEDDGEFWMPWDDFTEQFTDVSINHVINTSLFSFYKTWKQYTKEGNWTRPDRCGGCLNYPESFLANPQYRFDVTTKDNTTEEVIIQLSQNDDNRLATRERIVIGMHIWKVECNRKFRIHKINLQTVKSSDFIKSRHVFYRTSLKPGRYCIIPSSFKPGEDGQFLIRIFGDEITGFAEMIEDEPKTPNCGCIFKGFQTVTRVTVRSIKGLPEKKGIGKTDPYVTIKCEGETVKSSVVENSLNPEFNFSAIFYRKDPDKDILVQVWDHNMLMDSFLGQVTISRAVLSDFTGTVKSKSSAATAEPDNPFGDTADDSVGYSGGGVVKLDLRSKDKNKLDKLPGTIELLLENDTNLAAF